MTAGNQTALLVWDVDGPPAVGDWTAVLWRSFGDSALPENVSIPSLVEMHDDKLRARYLAWIYELGERRIQGHRVVDHLELRPGFSYWWMTLFAEKCNYAKSPQITDAIRLMAFDDWASETSFDHVVLASANHPLAECIQSWCIQRGCGFERQEIADMTESQSLVKRVYQAIPYPLQALAWLPRYLIDRWPFKNVGLKEWQLTDGRVTFFSYLFNLVPGAAKNGRYESRYWAHLPEDLQREGCKTNWLHLYVKDALLPTARKGADAIRQFNETGRGEQRHVTLDAFLGAIAVLKTLGDWCRLAWIGRRLHKTVSSTPNTELDIWPLFEKDWRQSMFGPAAMSNVLYLNLLESAMKCLPKQQAGVYLQENQGWEIALNYAWKAAGHGRLMGVPHSTVRYWDLRYFFDPRSYSRKGGRSLPLPDQVLFNGPAMFDAYKNGGYRVEEMVEVEALRYLYLCNNGIQPNLACDESNSALRVLVLGDYLMSNTQLQMRLLEKAIQLLPQPVKITVKSHPNTPVQMTDYPKLKMEMSMEPVSALLAGCDVAYTSSVTAASVDAYCSGVPVISVLDPNALNQSPLRGRNEVLFASTQQELASALTYVASTPRSALGQQNFFTLDPQLPRWRKLLLGS